ncbi:MAG: Qat anti-phage system QueC-like protein QatC [Bacillota bacterium]
MRQHVIIGRYGPGDLYHRLAGKTEVVTNLELVSGERQLKSGIGRALEDLTHLGVYPTEIGVDLLVLAAHVFAADTRISRVTESQDSWTREIRLVVPVSDPDRWATGSDTLVRMLNFLTGDRWEIGFRSRPQGFATLTRHRSVGLRRPRFNKLALFSGGLDSLIGAVDLLEAGNTPLFVSHAGEGAISDAQQTLFRTLRAEYSGRPFDRLRIWMTFPKDLVAGSEGEPTTRGRSFLFFSLGIFAGTGLEGDFTLLAPENGLIALNVPLDPLRLGALSTRTTHPFYIARWNELLAQLDLPGKIENPYWNCTKGEMVASCANSTLLRRLIPLSLSCSSPSKGRWLGFGPQHCGYCVPCLIRRAAIDAGLGRGSDTIRYTIADLTARPLDTGQAKGQSIRSFQLAIERLRSRPDLATILVHKPGPLTDVSPDQQAVLAEVYRRGLEEVNTLLNGVTTRSE